jgi:hypothetical protein
MAAMAAHTMWSIAAAQRYLGLEQFNRLCREGVLRGVYDSGALFVEEEAVLKAAGEQVEEDVADEDKAIMDRVPQRYSPELDPIQVGDKVTARQMLLDENGEVLAKPGERLVVMGRDGPHWLLANGRGGRGRATTSQLRKGYANQAAFAEETADNVLYEGMEYEEGEDEEIVP